jgi:flavin-dependent dehydrogenase
MSDVVDVLVIGAGPAGSVAAAVVHQSGLSVRVVERDKFPRFVIGESLLPRCMEVFEQIDMLDVLKSQNFQEKFGAKFMRGDDVTDFRFADQFSTGWTWTWQVQRARFDQVLIQEVQRRGVPVDFETTVSSILIHQDETSITSVRNADGVESQIRARFIVDASGYGRVIPKLFKLDKPSQLDPRMSLFAHVKDLNRKHYDEPNRIIAIMYAPGVWTWLIPLSEGITSLGFVGPHGFFDGIPGGDNDKFHACVSGNDYLRRRFSGVPLVFEPKKLEAWSSSTERFYGAGFVLTGNVTEFLDPIFSSGVMFAAVSSQRASQLVVEKLRGNKVNWDRDYTNYVKQGVDTFRTFVVAWYDGTLEKIFFSRNSDPLVKGQICSVLAGYVWDEKNPFVRAHEKAVRQLARLISVRESP